MKPNELIEVLICCNDHQSGHFLGFLTGFSIRQLDLVCIDDAGSPEFLFDGNYLRIDKLKFYVADRIRHVGNQAWDAVWMPAESVCGLLNWARSNDFHPESTPDNFGEVWDSGYKLQLEHLDMLF